MFLKFLFEDTCLIIHITATLCLCTNLAKTVTHLSKWSFKYYMVPQAVNQVLVEQFSGNKSDCLDFLPSFKFETIAIDW